MQPAPDLLGAIDAITGIPAPAPILIHPRIFAAYGALIAATTLTTLYVYRGRAFIVYWIGSWLLFAGSLLLVARGYADARLGSVMVGLGQLLALWSAGLLVLSAGAFPVGTLRWTIPLRVAAFTAVWFLAAPLLISLDAVQIGGLASTALLVGWAGLRYLKLVLRTRYIGVGAIGSGMVVLASTGIAGAAVTAGLMWDANALNSLLAVNVIVTMLVALGMHVVVFEDMTEELRRSNRDLEKANLDLEKANQQLGKTHLALGNAHLELKRLAIIDPLTGCLNRRFLDEIQSREVQRHRRYNAPLSVIFIDVNRFKQLNDSHGHDMGDRMLTEIGQLLRRHVRESDYVIRWGGDEFLLLLTCTVSDAERKADELRAAFDPRRITDALPEGFGLSLGIAAVPPDAEDLEEAIRKADASMYREKLGGRGPALE